MLFDDEDSYELDSFENPPKCVALPLKAFISLKDLWVPSELLPSRNNNIFDSNRNKSHIFHTLEKKDFVSLSVYLEDSEKNLDNRPVPTNPLAYTGLNNQSSSIIDEIDPLELYHSENSDEHLNVSENEKQITDFFRKNSRAHLYEEVKLYEESFSNKAVTEPSITYRKSESDDAKQFGYFLDIINNEEPMCSDSYENCTNEAATKFLIRSGTPEKEECNDSIQFIHLSETVNPEELSCEDSLVSCANDISDLALQKPAYYNCDNVMQYENLGTVSTKQTSCNDIAKCPSKAITELQISCDKPLNEGDKDQQLLDAGSSAKFLVVEPEKSQYEPVIELPIAYKRPVLEESRKKQRNQKEKKKKPAVKKNLLLGDFLQIANANGYDDLPKKDEFYENLVRRGICSAEKLNSEVEYSRYTNSEEEYFGISIDSHLKEESFGFHHQSCSGDLFEPSVLKENKLKSDPVPLSPVDKEPTTTLVLENVPKDITKENMESFLSGYGELKELSLEPCGKFVKVFVKLILDCDDVDWLIECLNETEPFGVGGVVKCYKL